MSHQETDSKIEMGEIENGCYTLPLPLGKSRTGTALILAIVFTGIMSIFSMYMLNRMFWSARFATEQMQYIQMYYINQAGKEHAFWYVKNNSNIFSYSSSLYDLSNASGQILGQFVYMIEDVTPADSDPIKQITVTGYIPSRQQVLLRRQLVVFTLQKGSQWETQSEFPPER